MHNAPSYVCTKLTNVQSIDIPRRCEDKALTEQMISDIVSDKKGG